MKSILSKILICSLVLSFGLGSAVLWRLDNAKASLAPAVNQAGSAIIVASQPAETMPELSVAPLSSPCALDSVVQNNLVQATGGVNFNQFADCFSISVAGAPQPSVLAIAQPQVLPDLAVATGPSWTPDQVGQSAKSSTMPVAAATFVLIAVTLGASRLIKRTAILTYRSIYLPTSLTLAELQVFRC